MKPTFLLCIIDIYLPEGVEIPECNVLKLQKSLYGLKQSTKCWDRRFDDYITSIEFSNSELLA